MIQRNKLFTYLSLLVIASATSMAQTLPTGVRLRQQGIQVVDPQSGTVLQTIPQPSAFLGLAFSHDGKTLYATDRQHRSRSNVSRN